MMLSPPHVVHTHTHACLSQTGSVSSVCQSYSKLCLTPALLPAQDDTVATDMKHRDADTPAQAPHPKRIKAVIFKDAHGMSLLHHAACSALCMHCARPQSMKDDP